MTEIPGLVSTIIPVFNRPAMLREAVDSVLAQTYRPIEVILVDDGSSDETGAVCDELAAAHPEIRVVHQPNAGPGAAREAGRRIARGEFIQYLDSDDRLLPRKFERQVEGLAGSSECGAAYCFTRYLHADGRAEMPAWKGSGREVATMFPSFLNERWWDTPTPLYRRSVTDTAGPWTDLRLEEDWEYDCRIAALGTRLVQVPEFLVEVRDHEDGRLCEGEALDPGRLRERARSHRLVYSHAERAGIHPDSSEMKQYARELFHLARQCGAAGLERESRELFGLAREASGDRRSRAMDFRLYGLAATILGWKAVGSLACARDRRREARQRSRSCDSPLHLERGGRRPG